MAGCLCELQRSEAGIHGKDRFHGLVVTTGKSSVFNTLFSFLPNATVILALKNTNRYHQAAQLAAVVAVVYAAFSPEMDGVRAKFLKNHQVTSLLVAETEAA